LLLILQHDLILNALKVMVSIVHAKDALYMEFGMLLKTSKIICPGVNHAAKMNESFRNKDDPENHMGFSLESSLENKTDRYDDYFYSRLHASSLHLV